MRLLKCLFLCGFLSYINLSLCHEKMLMLAANTSLDGKSELDKSDEAQSEDKDKLTSEDDSLSDKNQVSAQGPLEKLLERLKKWITGQANTAKPSVKTIKHVKKQLTEELEKGLSDSMDHLSEEDQILETRRRKISRRLKAVLTYEPLIEAPQEESYMQLLAKMMHTKSALEKALKHEDLSSDDTHLISEKNIDTLNAESKNFSTSLSRGIEGMKQKAYHEWGGKRMQEIIRNMEKNIKTLVHLFNQQSTSLQTFIKTMPDPLTLGQKEIAGQFNHLRREVNLLGPHAKRSGGQAYQTWQNTMGGIQQGLRMPFPQQQEFLGHFRNHF